MAALLDLTLSRPLRHCLLRLAEALLLPAAARGDERAARAAAANADAFIAAGGVQLAVDLVAGAPQLGLASGCRQGALVLRPSWFWRGCTGLRWRGCTGLL